MFGFPRGAQSQQNSARRSSFRLSQRVGKLSPAAERRDFPCGVIITKGIEPPLTLLGEVASVSETEGFNLTDPPVLPAAIHPPLRREGTRAHPRLVAAAFL